VTKWTLDEAILIEAVPSLNSILSRKNTMVKEGIKSMEKFLTSLQWYDRSGRTL
jgi:hypothetical protein